jgi:transcriptional regulator with XRE-family HTH domain
MGKDKWTVVTGMVIYVCPYVAMATKPHRHVLRTLRTRYGLSQQKLAKMVGCSLTTIKQVETGRLSPSAQLAHRIYMFTGLDPGQLMENSFPETPFHVGGEELTKETFIWIQQGHREATTREQIDATLVHLQAVLTTLLDASGPPGKLWALRPALQDAITKLTCGFGLEADFRRLFSARYGLKDPWSIVDEELFKAQREHAEQARCSFYELQAARNGQHAHGKRKPGIGGTDSTAERRVPNSIDV